MSATWRLLEDGALGGANNMARDTAILEQVAAGASPPTLRIYGWQPSCLSLGRHQGMEAADTAFCQARGVDIVRRPTGGRAVLHHLEVTYSVIAPLGGSLPRGSQQAYRAVCEVLVEACTRLGVAAELTSDEANQRLPGPRSSIPCFKAPAGGEVVVGQRKLVGSAMRTHRGAVLQHGSLLLDWDGDLQAGVMGLADDRDLRPFLTTLTAELAGPVDPAEVHSVLVQAFAEGFEIELLGGQLSADEQHSIPGLEARFRILDPELSEAGA